LSFSSEENFERLKHRLREINPSLADEVEEEYVFLYPHVAERLNKAGIRPKIAYSPSKIPSELV